MTAAPSRGPQRVETADDTVRIVDLVAVVWSEWRVVALVAAMFSVIALVAALVATPQYRATTLLAPAESSKPEGGLAGLASRLGGLADLDLSSLGGGQDVDQTLTLLGSRSFTENFISQEGMLPHLYADQWDEKNKKWRTGAPTVLGKLREWWRGLITPVSGKNGTLRAVDGGPLLWVAAKKFDTMRIADKDRRTQIISLSVTWEDPELAAKWANDLAESLNAHARTRAIAEAEKATGFLKDQIQKTSVVELQQVLYRLLESEEKKITLATVREEYALQVLDPALPPPERISPKRTLMVFSGVLGGTLAGVMFVLIRRFVFQGVRRSR
jgi:uncharacterized protein involved in exopolysaccharide biosynthesis